MAYLQRYAWVLAACIGLSACSTEPPPVPPAELIPTSAERSLLRIWSAKVGEAGRGVFEPNLQDQQIVVANRDGRVTSLADDNGMRQWRVDIDTDLSSGVGGDANQLYVSDIKGTVHAMNAKTGQILWATQASSEILVPVAAGFGMVVVRSTDGRVLALEPDDGAERWSVSNTPPALTVNGYSQPLLLQGGVLVGLDDGRLLALNAESGNIIWESVISVPSGRTEVERLVDIDANILVDDEGIFLANYQGKVARVEPSRGQLVWSVPLSAGSGLALSDNSLVVVDEKDTLVKLDKQTGQVIWQNNTMPGRRLSPPAFTPDGNIIVGDVEGYLHLFSNDSGEAIGRTRLSKEAIKARPVIKDDTIYVQTTDGLVAAYRVAR